MRDLFKELNSFWSRHVLGRPDPVEAAPVELVTFKGAPTPDDLALAFADALMQTGKYETPGAAIAAAWAVIPEFYLSRVNYAQNIAPLFFSPAESPPEAPSDQEEWPIDAALGRPAYG